ncbi:hypothetical protein O181_006394 [Austropuccinia psidii MF-1]|uniref:Uncharacterized protein n=1 Tax=Austropuccinia psidii MF-1 TaxID=1389203 RepID=A0A9Q3BJ82_9BASI|nr:hypothetical protein [Austropuccinia psidii MF-1]
MTPRRGSQFSIQLDLGGLRGGNYPTEGKRKGKICTNSISQMQVPEMPIISEPELELSMSHSNRNQSHSEGSEIILQEPVQAVLHSLKRKIFENAAPNPPRSDDLLVHPQNIPKGGGNSEILKWMESTIIQALSQ